MNPALKKGPWDPEEDVLIIDRRKTMGWADIAKEMGRSPNAIKYRWNSFSKKRKGTQKKAKPKKKAKKNAKKEEKEIVSVRICVVRYVQVLQKNNEITITFTVYRSIFSLFLRTGVTVYTHIDYFNSALI